MRLLQVLRLFIVTFAIVINCSPNGDALQLPNQCRIKVPGGETVVSWWVLLTKSTQDAKQAQHRLWYKPVDQNVVSDLITMDDVVALMGAHNSHTRENADAITAAHGVADLRKFPFSESTWGYKKFGELTEKDLGNEVDAISKRVEVIQVWANDQPAKQMIGRLTTAPKEFRFAHSKWLISISKNGAENFFLQHSFPRIPNAVENTYQYFRHKPEPRTSSDPGFWSTPKGSRFVKSQHAICINVNDMDKMRELMQGLQKTYPLIVARPVPEPLIKSHPLYDALKSFYNRETPPDEACNAAWTIEKEGHSADELASRMFVQEVSQACTTSMTLHVEGLKFTFVFHAPLRHPPPNRGQKKNEDADTDGKICKAKTDKLTFNYSKHFKRGPIPWLAVAKIMSSSLQVMCWKNANFPTISHGTPQSYRPDIGYNVELVTSHTRGKEQVDSGSMHEKIGVGIGNRVLCFGDSNYRPSEVTHAGAMVCFPPPENTDKEGLYNFFSATTTTVSSTKQHSNEKEDYPADETRGQQQPGDHNDGKKRKRGGGGKRYQSSAPPNRKRPKAGVDYNDDNNVDMTDDCDAPSDD